MDEHKKQMIQEWVEGQALAHNHAAPRPGPPPPNLTGLESLAWLEAASGLAAAANSSSYRVFTQFKMAESSTSSCSEEVRSDTRRLDEWRKQFTKMYKIRKFRTRILLMFFAVIIILRVYV
jgi:hypothetical protein